MWNINCQINTQKVLLIFHFGQINQNPNIQTRAIERMNERASAENIFSRKLWTYICLFSGNQLFLMYKEKNLYIVKYAHKRPVHHCIALTVSNFSCPSWFNQNHTLAIQTNTQAKAKDNYALFFNTLISLHSPIQSRWHMHILVFADFWSHFFIWRFSIFYTYLHTVGWYVLTLINLI